MNSTCVNIPQIGLEPISAPSMMQFYPLNYWRDTTLIILDTQQINPKA